MTKTLIHTILVSKPGEKVQLQIKLPRNTKSIQAIKITANGFPKKPITKWELGWLWLRIPEHRDVFFADVVKVPFEEFGRTTYADLPSLSIGQGHAWVDGGKETAFSVTIDKCSTMLEGYYTDQLKTEMVKKYIVNIYLTLEV